MKILQIINSHRLQDGGAQRLALEMHRSYLESGHDSHLLSLMESPVDEKNTYTLGHRTPYKLKVLIDLRHFLHDDQWKDIDLIHVHLFPAQLWVALAAGKKGAKVPFITTEHNTFNRRRGSRVGRALDRITLKRYRRIVCISPATQEALAHWQPQTRKKLTTILNGIDLKRYSQLPQTPNFKKVPVIIAVGRISEQKNYATAIEAIALLGERPFEFWIVGKDEKNGELQKLAAQTGVANNVRFMGYREDIPQLLQQADIFLLTSLWEGFGLAVAEAMAAGLPVVCSDVPGVREVVGSPLPNGCGSGHAGFLTDPNSPAEIAEKLALLLDDATLRHSLGNGAVRQASRFDISRTIASYLALYEDEVRTSATASEISK